MHLATPPPRLEDVVPNIRAKALLQPLLDRGLAKDPAERFQTAEQFLDEIKRALRAGVDREVHIEPTEAARAGLAPPANVKPAPERRGPGAKPRELAQSRPNRLAWLAQPSRLLVVILAVALAGLALWLAWGYVK
jgi:serine/threonine-protein kinase